jgi:hypothetical protein
MASAIAACSVVAPATIFAASSKTAKASRSVAKAPVSLSQYGGLRVQSRGVSALSEERSVNQQFAQATASVRQTSSHSKGGALVSKADLAAEMFPIIPIISGLVLTGIAIGFLLLRVEAALEESE